MATFTSFIGRPAAAAALALATGVHAQPTTMLSPVTVTGRQDRGVDIGGWGDIPLSKAPFQASSLGSEQMQDIGMRRLSDIVRIDPAISDAYNTEGYWDYLTVRGYVIDNRFNYRRDGLPINAETSIPLDNKDSVEVLRGTSGLQAGTSAPGGLVNLVVKRPTDAPLRNARLGWRESGSVLGAVDISERFGTDGVFGLRINAAAERLEPRVRPARGERHMVAAAGDWRLAAGTLIEAEFESSHRSQPSVPGFSLLGDTVPDPRGIDPRINLNNQPWSLPVVFDSTTASLRVTQRLSDAWRLTAHAATQRLKTDDRIAFPFGCAADNPDFVPPLTYCADGSFDLYDYRSENERRRTDALELALHGALSTGGVRHDVSAGVLRNRSSARLPPQAFNFVGTGNVQGTLVTPPDPTTFPVDADRDERSTELFARDAMRVTPSTTAWLGLRHTRLERSFSQSFTTPWLALSHELPAGTMVYASAGQGVESLVTPNLRTYASAGQPLAPAKSRQFEIGVKGGFGDGSWTLAWFDIDRPVATDTGTVFFIDGSQRHRGIDAAAAWQTAGWSLQGGVQLLRARREGSQDPSVNGLRPTNVPAATLKLQARHDLAALPGLSVQGNLLAEGERIATPDNGTRIPGYGRVDVALRYQQPRAFGTFTWRAGIDNLLDRRAWREAPNQFGHVYLFPLAPRTLRLSIEAAL
ncbi:TonB-dependent siderophore receptor [Piscinibacter sp.]|uniref:TonB-dependent siderophore receptor n=1 Tax=Piscinibacter sp. TaxID=1903157 RepID=UPI002C01A363|nr:TonB-dependent siderophore receptor [Albitalea sp.]HUG23261.1 TonB-dependent siderophore receptor [Albitalea sp.]